MRYFMGEIRETNGGMDYTSPFKFKVKAKEDPDTIMDAIAANWRGDGEEPNGVGEYESDGTYIQVADYEEISQKLFATRIPYIHDLTP